MSRCTIFRKYEVKDRYEYPDGFNHSSLYSGLLLVRDRETGKGAVLEYEDSAYYSLPYRKDFDRLFSDVGGDEGIRRSGRFFSYRYAREIFKREVAEREVYFERN